MARYGDLNELKLKVQRYMISNDGSGLVSIEVAERWFLKLLDDAPTADVVPKSEVEKIIEDTFKRIEENFVNTPIYKIAPSDLKAELKKKYIPQNAEKCVVCGDVIPEGRQVCHKCERSVEQ